MSIGAIAPIALFGLTPLWLASLQIKHFVPFDFSKLKGNHPDLGRRPDPTKFKENVTARETGELVSTGVLPTLGAIVIAAVVITLLASVISIPSGAFHSPVMPAG